MSFVLLVVLASCAAPSATVYFFVGPECPVSNFYAPEIERLAAVAAARGARVVAVYPEPGVTAEVAGRHAAEYGLTLPRVLDPDLARRLEVSRIPQAVVVSRQGEVVYRGRIDDRYSPEGKRRDEPRTRDLEEALQAILSGRLPAVKESPVFGCPIEVNR